MTELESQLLNALLKQSEALELLLAERDEVIATLQQQVTRLSKRVETLHVLLTGD